MKETFTASLSLLLIAAMLLAFPICVNAQEADFSASCSVCTEEDERIIWEYLYQLTGNPIAAAGIMGNLYYESHLLSQAVETIGKAPEEYVDIDYIADLENGTCPEFAEDGRGFGLAQWTYAPRKLRLQEIAETSERSVGDLGVQLYLLSEELEKFNMMYRLQTAGSIRFASDYFLVNFENPSDQSESVKQERAEKGQYFYDKHTKPQPKEAVDDGLTAAQREVALIASNSEAYGIPADAGYCQAWATAVYRKAGFSVNPSPSAAAGAEEYLVSTDLDEIPVGAAVYGRARTKYGHVGIYIGDGRVSHNIGSAVTEPLEDWIKHYDGFGWGWVGGIDLTKDDN